MASLEPKKLAILRIWQILQKHSDYDHPLTQEEIIKYLKNDYGIKMERKAMGINAVKMPELISALVVPEATSTAASLRTPS